jgi:NodT family efflux transporter outer membrane factor (OMF) lipoprotein
LGTKKVFWSAAARSVAALLATTALSACEMGPNFSPPRPAVPAAYIADQPATEPTPYTTGDAVDPTWWENFNDPELTKLEGLAVSQNLDLQIATERLLEAEAQAQITGAVLYPNLSGAASYTREGPSKEGIFNAFGGGASASTSAGSVASGAAGTVGGGAFSASSIAPLDLYQYGLQSMYDLDLWGKNRRAVEAAVAAARGSEEARRAALLNVEAQVASNYIQMRGTETILAITQKNLSLAKQLVDLTVERQQAGLTTSLDVANARATEAEIESQIPTLTAQRDTLIGQIGLLLGVTPQTLPAELTTPQAVPLTPPSVPIGLPGDLLRRRPDVREAEQDLHEATAETGVAVASFFPDISLSGSVSLQALQFKNLNEFKAITYAFGPDITIPLFEGGQLTGQLKLRRAQQREAALNYAKTVLTAFYQVDTSLVNYNQEHAALDALTVDTQQSQIALGLAEDQYKQGLADYLTVLDAQQSFLNAQQSQAAAVERVATDLVTLYQALGGGWEQTYPDYSQTTIAEAAPAAAAAAAPAVTPAPAATPAVAVAPTAPAAAAPAEAAPAPAGPAPQFEPLEGAGSIAIPSIPPAPPQGAGIVETSAPAAPAEAAPPPPAPVTPVIPLPSAIQR